MTLIIVLVVVNALFFAVWFGYIRFYEWKMRQPGSEWDKHWWGRW